MNTNITVTSKDIFFWSAALMSVGVLIQQVTSIVYPISTSVVGECLGGMPFFVAILIFTFSTIGFCLFLFGFFKFLFR